MAYTYIYIYASVIFSFSFRIVKYIYLVFFLTMATVYFEDLPPQTEAL